MPLDHRCRFAPLYMEFRHIITFVTCLVRIGDPAESCLQRTEPGPESPMKKLLLLYQAFQLELDLLKGGDTLLERRMGGEELDDG